MAWTTPITDRALSDITERTSKGFFNVSDWQRINENTFVLNGLVNAKLTLTIPFVTLTEPTIATIPSMADITALITNISVIRTATATEVPYQPELKNDYVEGINSIAITWQDVNIWEQILDMIHEWVIL